MKHHEIRKVQNGWTEAEVTAPNGCKIAYSWFASEKEAETWCYAKVRHLYGAETANKEFRR